MTGWGDFKSKAEIPYKSKAEKVMAEIFLDVVTEDLEEPYIPQIRASSLPICILLHAQAVLKPHVRLNEAKLAQYSSQGTALHELYQDQFLRNKRWGKYVYGDFVCRNKRCEKILDKECNRPKDWATRKCPHCGSIGLKYSEVEAQYKGVIGIHVDMILRFKKDKVWLMDFKTTSTYKVEDTDLKPKLKHVAQISSYPIILEYEKGLTVEKFFLGYCNREKSQFSKTSKRQSRWFPFKTDTKTMKKRKTILDKLVIAESVRQAYFSHPDKEKLEKLDNLRPCKCLEDYEGPLGMEHHFEGDKRCVYANAKGCFKSGLSKASKDLEKLMEERTNV